MTGFSGQRFGTFSNRAAAERYVSSLKDPAKREKARKDLGLDAPAPETTMQALERMANRPAVDSGHLRPSIPQQAGPVITPVTTPVIQDPLHVAAQQKGARVFVFTLPALPCYQKTKGADGKTRKAKDKPMIPKLVGYYTNGKEPNFDRANEYAQWKRHVVRHAPPELRNLTSNNPQTKAVVNIRAYFPRGQHCDVENLRKGIVDSLFSGGDKWVAGMIPFPEYDKENPRVEVEVILFAQERLL